MTDDIPPVPSHGFATPAEVAELRATIAGLEAKLAKMQRSRDRYREAWEAEKSRAALSGGTNDAR